MRVQNELLLNRADIDQIFARRFTLQGEVEAKDFTCRTLSLTKGQFNGPVNVISPRLGPTVKLEECIFEGPFRVRNPKACGDPTDSGEAQDNGHFEANFRRSTFGDVLLFAGGDPRVFENTHLNFQDVEFSGEASPVFRRADLSQARFLHTNLREIEWADVVWGHRQGTAVYQRRALHDESLLVSESEEDSGEETSSSGSYEDVKRLYRQLKQNFDERGDYLTGGDFHVGEKEMRRQNRSWKTSATWWLLTAYRYGGGYGERILPAVLTYLFFTVLIFPILYHSAGLTPAITPDGLTSVYLRHWYDGFRYSFYTSAFFRPPADLTLSHAWGQFVSILQRLLSPVFLTLIALAVRRQTKR